MLTSEEKTWITTWYGVPDTTITDVVFAALSADKRYDLTCCAISLALMNRDDPTDSDSMGAKYYETVTVPSTLLDDIKLFVESTEDPTIFPGAETDLIPRNSRWQFRKVLDYVLIWDLSTGTWNAGLSASEVLDELELLFHYFGMSGENGWERLFRYEQSLRQADRSSITYTDPMIPTSGNGIVHPAAWDVTAQANNHKSDFLGFFADVVEDNTYLNSTQLQLDQPESFVLDQVGLAVRNLQGYDQGNVRPDQTFVFTADYRSTERVVDGGESFRQKAVQKAFEAKRHLGWA